MAEVDYTSILSLDKAHVIGETHQGLTNDSTLTLEWEKLDFANLEEASDWEVYNRKTLYNLKAGYNDFDGYLRSDKIETERTDRRGTVLRHTFKHGWITSLMSTGSPSTFLWDNARLLEGLNKPPGTNTVHAMGGTTQEDYIVVAWPNCSPDDVLSIIDEIKAQTVDAWHPMIRGDDYGSGWHRIRTHYKIEEDGSATVILALASPEFSIDAYETWITGRSTLKTYHWNVPKERVQGIVDGWKKRGAEALVSYDKSSGLSDIVLGSIEYLGESLLGDVSKIDCDTTEYTSYYWGVDDASLYTAPAHTAPGQTWSKRVYSQRDGSFDVVITNAIRSYREYEYIYSSTSALGNDMVYRMFGVMYDSGIPDITNPEQGQTYRQEVRIRDDCTRDVETVLSESTPSEIEFQSLSTLFKDGTTIIYRNAHSVPTTPTATGSGIYRVEVSPNPDGTYNGQLTHVYGTNQGVVPFHSLDTKFRNGDSILYESVNTSIQAPSAETGIYRVSQQLNEDGTYSGQLVYEVGTGEGEVKFHSMDTSFRVGDSILYKSSPVPINAPSATGSGMYRVQQSMDEDGFYDGTLVYEVGTNSGAAKFHSLDTLFRVGDSILYKAQTSPVDAPQSTGSGVYRVSQSLGEDGLYDSLLVYEVGTNSGIVKFHSLDTMFRVGDSILYKASTDPIEAPLSTGSGVYRVSQSLGEDGLYDGMLVYEAGTNAGVAKFHSLDTMFRVGDSILYKATTSPIDAPSSTGSGVYRVSQSVDEDGLYDSLLVYEVGTNSGSAKFHSLDTLFRVGDSILYKASTNPIQAPSSTSSGAYRVSQSLGEDGLYDGLLVYEVGTNNGEVRFHSGDTKFLNEDSILYKSITMPIQSPEAEFGEYRVNMSLGEDGLYDGVLVYSCPTGEGAVYVRTSSGVQRIGGQAIYRYIAEPIAVVDRDTGKLQRANVSLNSNGTYDETIETVESTPLAYDFKSARSRGGSRFSRTEDNNVSLLDIPAVPDYGLYTVSQRLNEDGTFSGQIDYSIQEELWEEVFDSSKSEMLYSTTVMRHGAAEVPTIGELSTGQVASIGISMGRDGLIDSSIEYQYSVPVIDDIDSEVSELKMAKTYAVENLDADITGPTSSTQGVIYRASSRRNRDGSRSGAVVYDESNPVWMGVSGLESATRNDDNRRYVNWRDGANYQNASTGVLVRRNLSINQDGTYDVAVSSERSVHNVYNVDRKQSRGGRTDSVIVENEHDQIYITQPSSGATTVSQRLNDDGTFSGVIDIFYARDWTEDVEAEDSVLSSTNAILYKSGANVPNIVATQERGHVKSVGAVLGEDGLIDAKYSDTVSYAASVKYDSSIDEENEIYSIKGYNIDSITDAPSVAYASASLDQSINRDGTYDYSMRVDFGIDNSVGPYTHSLMPEDNWVDSLEVFKNSSSVPELGEYEYGRVNWEANKYGLYDGTKLLRTLNESYEGWLSAVEEAVHKYRLHKTDDDRQYGTRNSYYREMTVVEYSRRVPTFHNAMTHISGGYTFGPFQSQWNRVDNGRYIAIKYLLVDSGSWIKE